MITEDKFDAALFDNSNVYFTEGGRLLTRDDLPDCDVEAGEFQEVFVTNYTLIDEIGQGARCSGAIVASDKDEAGQIAKRRGLDEVVVGRLV